MKHLLTYLQELERTTLQELLKRIGTETEETIASGSVHHSSQQNDDNDLEEVFFGSVPEIALPNNDEWVRYSYELPVDKKSNPLDWWKCKKVAYPHLFEEMLRCLCVPATSATAERTFSTAGLILNKKRSRLSLNMVDQLVFLNKC